MTVINTKWKLSQVIINFVFNIILAETKLEDFYPPHYDVFDLGYTVSNLLLAHS